MRILLLLVTAVLCLPGLVFAQLKMNEFAYGIRVDVHEKTAVATMSLPEQVYMNAYRIDLGDMRVFNAAGEPVPHMIRYSRSRAAESPWRKLAFFPISEVASSDAGGYRIYVHTGPNGAIVGVDPMMSASPSSSARTWLIDTNQMHGSLAQLLLEWKPMQTNRISAISIDAGDDLTSWTTVRARATLSDIRYAGRRLLRNTIALKRTSKRYLRLRHLDSGPNFNIVKIEGRAEPEGRRPIRAILKLDGQAASGSPGVFEYQTAGVFPVDRVNLIFKQANSVADAIVESRSDSSVPWIRRTKGIFYRIDMESALLSGNPLAVSINMDRHWRVTVDDSDSTIGKNIPSLEIGYRPHDLFFIARGNGPFTIAYGSSRIKPLKINAAALFDGIGRQRPDDFERWVRPAGPPVVLGGPEQLAPQPKPLPTRRIVLWSILLGGVIVVAAMAWHLARRMAQGG